MATTKKAHYTILDSNDCEWDSGTWTEQEALEAAARGLKEFPEESPYTIFKAAFRVEQAPAPIKVTKL